jgi:hypothetical protein
MEGQGAGKIIPDLSCRFSVSLFKGKKSNRIATFACGMFLKNPYISIIT